MRHLYPPEIPGGSFWGPGPAGTGSLAVAGRVPDSPVGDDTPRHACGVRHAVHGSLVDKEYSSGYALCAPAIKLLRRKRKARQTANLVPPLARTVC